MKLVIYAREQQLTELLKIPIVIITTLPSTPMVPFLSHEFLTTTPIYIACDYSGSGYYDATKNTQYLLNNPRLN